MVQSCNVAVVAWSLGSAAGRPEAQSGGARVVAVGDIHGAADAFFGILQSAGLIDAQKRWIGGRARLVQTGDFLDRGAGVRDIMDVMMRLEGRVM